MLTYVGLCARFRERFDLPCCPPRALKYACWFRQRDRALLGDVACRKSTQAGMQRSGYHAKDYRVELYLYVHVHTRYIHVGYIY